MPDNNSQGPTYFGQPSKQGIIGQTFFPQGTDPILNYIQRLNPLQQLAQAGSTGLGAYRQAFGYNAPSVEPIRREEERIFRQETLPQLMENLAGGGSQGALYRGIQSAQGDIATRLGALKQQQQFELQKQRQADLPRFRELEMQPTHQPHITNLPLSGQPNEPFNKENITRAGRAATGLGGELVELGEKGTKGISQGMFNLLNKVSPDLAAKYKTLEVDTGRLYRAGKNKLKEAGERAIEYGRTPGKNITPPELPPAPPNVKDKITKNEKRLSPKAKEFLDKNLYGYLSKEQSERINHILTRDRKTEFFPTLQYIKNPQQMDKWLNAMSRVSRENIEKDLDHLFKMIAAGKI